MVLELTVRRNDGTGIPNSPIDGIRVLAALPRHWQTYLRQAGGDIVVHVHTDESERVGDEVRKLFAGPENDEWVLVACRPLP
ncbi:hypothetical protein [Nonomuraea jiangxiensis]|uniref:Uncharacterized protein n=1 Tax=Nonomuraea jiangxiensis TaxID=633440 RepID=A0A1G8IK73_9ACTN|nr:hypothetical protein [Nonomuraea jiangxiensis]SDI19305.1 hypothetical protein SAMN05421869_104517 [Nonomuraea jiangxiensis]